MEEWIMENEMLRAVIRSDDNGVRITSLFHKKGGREWIRWSEEPLLPGAGLGEFDRQFRGGCEFLFPNDAPLSMEGDSLSMEGVPFSMVGTEWKDHGGLWRTRFAAAGVTEEGGRERLEFRGDIPYLETGVRMEFSLEQEGELDLRIGLKTARKEKLPYLLRFHPSLRVSGDSRLSCYGRRVEFEGREAAPGFSLEHLPESGEEELFCHVTQTQGRFLLEEGGCGLAFSYSPEQLPYLTLYYFQREGEKTLLAEPSTSNHMCLLNAIREGSARYLENGREECFSLRIRVY